MNNQQRGRKTALVTGASYGGGAATALVLAREGFDLVLTATLLENLDRTKATAEAAGARVTTIELDLKSQDNIDEAIDKALRERGRLDALVNNASAHGRKPALEIREPTGTLCSNRTSLEPS